MRQRTAAKNERMPDLVHSLDYTNTKVPACGRNEGLTQTSTPKTLVWVPVRPSYWQITESPVVRHIEPKLCKVVAYVGERDDQARNASCNHRRWS